MRWCGSGQGRIDMVHVCASRRISIQDARVLEDESQQVCLHVFPPPEIAGPCGSGRRDLFGEVVVRARSVVRRTLEEGENREQVRVVDFERHVTGEVKRRRQPSGLQKRERNRTGTHCTQGWTRSAYHSGKMVLLSTSELLDMRLFAHQKNWSDSTLPNDSRSKLTGGTVHSSHCHRRRSRTCTNSM